jgi:6-methylsalicylate decarboxylase
MEHDISHCKFFWNSYMSGKIDTHHHIVPPAYAAWLARRGISAGGLAIPSWSEEGALDVTDASGTETGIFSVSTPGVHLGDDVEAREKAREVNEFAANIVAKYPGRFGFFATLTLPDVEGAIAEAKHAFDTLGADGVVLISSVRGTYLGDEAWAPLFDELNRRHAVVFVHPGDLPAEPVPGIPPYAADFLLDTTRAAINIAKAGWLERFPNVKILLSHAGGFIPYAAQRIALIVSPDGRRDGGIARLRRFYFDTALSSSPYAMPSLLAFADPTHITFGSDWPYATKNQSLAFVEMLHSFSLTPDQRQAIYRGNAEQLFPRLSST